MKINRFTILQIMVSLVLVLCGPIMVSLANDIQEKHIIGWLETVQFSPENISLSAKIDTGADNSSLNIINPIAFNKDGEQWIRFTIPFDGNESVTLERPIIRYARIKRKGADSLKRPVVLFDLCFGKLHKKDVPVNLANRKGFKYPMLIGRSFLKGSVIVDSARTFTNQPSCSTPLSE